ncbi:MAG: T9SS type A sorting domain-containing protein [Paludibacteraceae bacterium]
MTTVTNKQQTNIHILPNPAKGYIYVTTANDELTGLKIQIWSILAKKHIETDIKSNNERVNISQLKSGIYFVNILKNNTILETKKIIIE